MSTVNPWLALPEGSPGPVLARRLRLAHEALVTRADAPAGTRVRPVVWDSWRRSLSSGVDPDGALPPVDLLDDDLADHRAAHPLAAVMPVIRRLLVADAEVDQMIVAVTDAAGRMLWVEGDSRLRDRAAGMHFVEGASWSEADAGTNAPGTALALDHAVQIYGGEHFRRPVQPWSCSAAPVHDPRTGALLGAIDVTGGDHVASPHVLTLVRATAAAAEAELRWLHRDRPVPSRVPAGGRPVVPSLEVLGRDRARLTTSAGTQELSLRHSELLVLLAGAATAGSGRTAEQLAAELHGGDAAAVTVRAELSRLRRLVGDQLVGSRPYRLVGPVRTDAEEVRTSLARGEVAAALDRYAGPLLPGSHAPGVRAARDRLAAELRRAVLVSGRPDLLVRYSALPEAADDLGTWQACAAVLPPGTRRTAAAAHVQRLRSRDTGPRRR